MQKNEIIEILPLNPHSKGYRIVFEKEDGVCLLGSKQKKRFEDLCNKVQNDPQKHLGELESFCREHAEISEAANLLAFAYLRLKKKPEAEKLIEKTYHDHPEYLIGKINYADQALRLGKKELIPHIFGNCFDLNALYPDREHFHFSEFRGFMTLMGFYHLEIGEKEKAEEYYQLAFQVDPLHPSVAALERKISKVSFGYILLLKKIVRTLQKLARISKNS